MKKAYIFCVVAALCVVAIGLFVACPRGGACDSNLIFHCSFDSAKRVERPEAGPAGLLSGAVDLREGKSGLALRVDGHLSPVSYALASNFIQRAGCVDFWAKIETEKDSFGVCDPRFYWIHFANGEESQIEFSANNGLGHGGLYGRMVHFEHPTHKGFADGERYENVLGEGGKSLWHHYAIYWNLEGVKWFSRPDGTHPIALLAVDGECVSSENFTHPDETKVVPNFVETVAQSATLTFPPPSGSQKAAYLIDEFRIWKTDSRIVFGP